MKIAKKTSGDMAGLTRDGATTRFQMLIEEMKLMLDVFPHLRDSYDPDELPVSFIVKRDAGRAEAAKSRTGRRAKRR
jgi:hypothetical protein